MNETQQVNIQIKAQVDEAQRAFESIKGSADSTFKQMESQATGVFGSIKNALTSANSAIMGAISSYGAITAAVGAVVYGIKDLTSAYAAQEKAEINLEGAMRKRGTYTADTMRQYKAFSEEMQNTVLIEDDEILKMLALGETYGLTGERLKEATRLSADMAVAFEDAGVTADQAMKMIGKAAQGDMGMLRRILGDSIDKAKDFDDVMNILNKTVGGRSADAAKGAEAEWKRLDLALGELKETIGKELTPTITEAIKLLAEFVVWIGKSGSQKEKVKETSDAYIEQYAAMKGYYLGLYDWITQNDKTLRQSISDSIKKVTEEEKAAYEKLKNAGVEAQRELQRETNRTNELTKQNTQSIKEQIVAIERLKDLALGISYNQVFKDYEDYMNSIKEQIDNNLFFDQFRPPISEGSYSIEAPGGIGWYPAPVSDQGEAYPGQYEPGEAEVIYAGGGDDIESRSWSFGGGLPGVGEYAKGTDYVPRTGLALVHQGEKIIPATQNHDNRQNVSITINHAPNMGRAELEYMIKRAVTRPGLAIVY